MATIYIYVLDTLADWELAPLIAELNSRRFFKSKQPSLSIQTVSYDLAPIKTMGGLTITPDCLSTEIEASKENVLLLPGADTWHQPVHTKIIEKASDFLESGAVVGAICGATVALANSGLLNDRLHTSNGPGFLEMMASEYQGTHFYIDQPAIADNNLITASCTGTLLWTKHIIDQLAVFHPETLTAWYDYFQTGKSEHYFALMQTLDKPTNSF